MNPKIKTFIRHYLAGLFSSAWNGGIGAVAGILGIDGASLVGVTDSPALEWKQMISAFCGAFMLHVFFWLKAHPLPENWSSTAPFYPPATPKDPTSSGPTLPTS